MSLVFQKPKPQVFLRVALPVLAVIFALGTSQFGAQLMLEGLLLTSLNFKVTYWGLVVLTGGLILLALLAQSGVNKQILRALGGFQAVVNKLGVAGLALFIVLAVAYPLVIFGFYGRFLENTFARLLAFTVVLLAGTTLLAGWRKSNWVVSLPLAALFLGATYSAATFLRQVSTYPFSLEWSEISRFYQASFFFSQKIYDVQLPLPVTHPSRYLLQSLPFLLDNSPLWLHRLWQALLWIGMPLVTGFSLTRRLKLGHWHWPFIIWSSLFLMQGAVFYHLLPCVFIVLLGFDKSRPWRSFFFVALASIWAGISRVNWIPLPGALAALLYFVEVRPKSKRSVLSFDYLWHPVVYAIGGSLIAVAAYALYIANSGVDQIEQFGSSFNSALLWNRLLPSGPFPPGILLGILLVSAPLFIAIWMRTRQRGSSLGFWRGAAILTLLSIFFLGGLVVSVKIGGGTNLHNMDAYMVLLWVLAACLAFGSYAADKKVAAQFSVSWVLLTALVTVPLLFAIFSGGPLDLPPKQVMEDALTQIRQLTAEATEAGGKVLFISQRHLLTFHLVEGGQLVPEYEKLFLMEMAISHNQAYLGEFWDLVDDQSFALIISDPLNTNINDESTDTLAEENNAWVREVSKPVLCAYEPLVTFQEVGIQILEPRAQKCSN